MKNYSAMRITNGMYACATQEARFTSIRLFIPITLPQQTPTRLPGSITGIEVSYVETLSRLAALRQALPRCLWRHGGINPRVSLLKFARILLLSVSVFYLLVLLAGLYLLRSAVVIYA